LADTLTNLKWETSSGDFLEGYSTYPSQPPPAYNSFQKQTIEHTRVDSVDKNRPISLSVLNHEKDDTELPYHNSSAENLGEVTERSEDNIDEYSDNIRDNYSSQKIFVVNDPLTAAKHKEDSNHSPEKNLRPFNSPEETRVISLVGSSNPVVIHDLQNSENANIDSNKSETLYPISPNLKSLFRGIENFVPDRVEIKPVLKPFPVDFLPAVGDVDPFIKIPRPDENLNALDYFDGLFLQIDTSRLHKNDELQLGLAVLDEPATVQSDPAIMDLRLSQLSGKSLSIPVKKLGRADHNARAHQIEQWIQSVRELRRTKPPDHVHYSHQMPDVEALMQEWPHSVEQLFRGMKHLLNENLDLELEDLVDVCLAIVNIPLHKNRTESLHLLFSLFSEFNNSQHFRGLSLDDNSAKEGGVDQWARM